MSSSYVTSSNESSDEGEYESSAVSESVDESSAVSEVEEVKVEKKSEKKSDPKSEKKNSKKKDGKITLEDTIITSDYAKKVKPEHYKFYYLEKDPDFEKIIKAFEPGEDDMEMFKGTNKRNRMIYPVEEGYFDWEEEHYKNFYDYLKENKFEGLKKTDKVRIAFQ
jgi:hypothetical protein